MDNIPSKSNTNNKLSTALIAVPLLLLAIFCGSIFWAFHEVVNQPPADVRIQEFTESLLSAIISYPDEPVPEGLLYLVDGSCWNFLRDMLARHGSEYTLEITVWGDEGTPAPGTGTTASRVQIVFPDGTRLALDSYGSYMLEVCRQLNDDE